MNERVLEQYKLVEEDFKERFPDVSYTMIVTVWDDGDFTVVAQHGDYNNVMHYVEFYSGRGTIEYTTHNDVGVGAIRRSRDGKDYYVPNELIKYLNRKNKKNLRILKK